jgi:hypothetical protein
MIASAIVIATLLLPRAVCLDQCAPTIQALCTNAHGRLHPACVAHIIRDCRHRRLTCFSATAQESATP